MIEMTFELAEKIAKAAHKKSEELNFLGLETKIIKSFFLTLDLRIFLSYLKNKSHEDMYISELEFNNFLAL